MEENKEYRNEYTERRINDNISPDSSFLDSEIHSGDKGLTNEDYKATRPKIAVSLSRNIALSKQNAIEPQLLKNDKPSELGKKDIQALFALNIYMSRWGADPQIQEYVRLLSQKIDPGIRIARIVDITELAGIIYMTPPDKTRERERVEVYERLKNLSKFRQHFKVKADIYDDEEGIIPNQTLEFDDQYLGSIGRTFSRPNRDGIMHVWAEIVFSPIFFHNLMGEKARFSPIDPSIMIIRGIEERKSKKGKPMPARQLNNNLLFWTILSDLSAERWRFVGAGVTEARNKAEKEIKEKKITNYGVKQKLIKEAIKKGLVYSVPVSKILEKNPSYTKNRKMMSRKGAKGDFWNDLNDTLKALKIIGYIDKDSFIEIDEENPTKSKVYFIYNMNYAKMQDFKIPPKNNDIEETAAELTKELAKLL